MTSRICKSCGFTANEIKFMGHICPECDSDDTIIHLPPNKYGGRCGNCKEYVKAGEGWYTKEIGVNHFTCAWKGRSNKDMSRIINSLPPFRMREED